jgi:hypothetical protein
MVFIVERREALQILNQRDGQHYRPCPPSKTRSSGHHGLFSGSTVTIAKRQFWYGMLQSHGGLTRSSEKNQPKKSNSTRQFDLMTETRIARAGSYIPKPTENDDENSTPNSRLIRHSVASCVSPNHNSDMDEKFTVMTQPMYRVTNPAD